MEQQSTKKLSEDGAGDKGASYSEYDGESTIEKPSFTGKNVLIGKGSQRITGFLVRMDTRFSTALLTNATISDAYGQLEDFQALSVVDYDWIGLSESVGESPKHDRETVAEYDWIAVVDTEKNIVLYVCDDLEGQANDYRYSMINSSATSWLDAHPDYKKHKLPMEVMEALKKRFVIVDCNVRIPVGAKVWTEDKS